MKFYTSLFILAAAILQDKTNILGAQARDSAKNMENISYLKAFSQEHKAYKLEAIDKQELIQGTWIKNLPKTSSKNSQFRYYILSLWEKKGVLLYNEFYIYPNTKVRSSISGGYAQVLGQNIRLGENYHRVVYNRGRGSPTPFKVETRQSNDVHEWTYQLNSDGSMQFNGSSLKSYEQLWSKALKEENILLAADLFMLNIYFLHNSLKDFGTAKMMRYRNETLAGPISGIITLDFQAEGLLGLGNSGVLFKLDYLQQFLGPHLEGSFFGGVRRLSGDLYVVQEDIKVFHVNFDKVRVRKGIAHEGVYRVNFIGGGINSVPVGRYGQ